MDVVDDAEGPLDPRIQIELENLNNATDEINKLEIELDEAHTAFRQLLSDSTRRLKEIANKLGASCIEKSRCYYEAVEEARQARVQCQQQAQLFQRASEIHAAAKETVTLAEVRFMSHQHEWNFDQAWQDMLNHATIKVMDAENQKAECGREHHRRAMLVHDAESKVQQLEEKYRRSIIKARPYFEVLAQCDQMLATQKERVEFLQKGVKAAKHNYSGSLRALEEISNQIHQQRRDYDIVANGPREPGVGAELISPPESLNYQAELNKLNVSRINSLASSNDTDIDDRSRDFEDVFELRQKMDQLSSRSVDGSESTSSQWELELQASMEKLNNLPMRKANFESIEGDYPDNGDASDVAKLESDSVKTDIDHEEKSEKNEEREHAKLPSDFHVFKKPFARTDSSSSSSQPHYLGWQSLTQSPINSILSKSKLALKNSFSKSLSNSPVNMASLNFARRKVEGMPTQSVQEEWVANETAKKNLTAQEESHSSLENVDTRITKDIESVNKVEINEPPRLRKIIPVDKSSADIEEFTENFIGYTDDRNDRVLPDENEAHTDGPTIQEGTTPSSPRVADQRVTNNQVQKFRERESLASRSVDSSPAKTRSPTSSRAAELADGNLSQGFFECSGLRKSKSRTSSVKELPLLAIFEPSAVNSMPKDRSCSMVNLAEKQNLKTLLDNTSLGNIQTVSVDKLASARQSLVNCENSDWSQDCLKK